MENLKQDNNESDLVIGVSSCLLGEQVRFDGGHKHNAYLTKTLSAFFRFESFCPEMAIGLGVPRKTIKLIKLKEDIRCVGSDDESQDYTQALSDSADQQSSWHSKLCGYVVKKSSPSCGMERVKVYDNGHPVNMGEGIYTKRMMENFPNLPVEEEGRLEDPVIRENFIGRVIFYSRWRLLLEDGLTLHGLTSFHAQHKLLFMSHDQDLCRSLGADIAKIREADLQDFIPQYISRAMDLMKIKASIGNHVNVLQHIQGYLKKHLDSEDKQELNESIEDYRLGRLPLIVPITLLRHHFKRHPNAYIENSVYMKPHPKELMLLNSL